MTKRLKTFCLFCWILCCFGSFESIAEDSITCFSTNWAPYYFQDNGNWKGVSIDAYRALTNEAGLKLEIKALPWSRAMKYIKAKPIIVSNMTPTDERKPFMFFLGPHYQEIMGIVVSVKYKNSKISTLNDLVDFVKKYKKKIIYQQDVFYSKDFNSRLLSDSGFADCFKKKVMNASDLLRLVEEDKYLGYINDKTGLYYMLNDKNMADRLYVHPFVLNQTDVYFGISKTIPPALYLKLKKANNTLLKTGVYKKIQQKWCP